MTWLLIPHDSVYTLIKSKDLRESVAEQILLEMPPPIESPITNNNVRVQASKGSIVLAVWENEKSDSQQLMSTPYLAIWMDPEASTLAALPDEILPDALERLCLVAYRLWINVAFPPNWRPARVESYQTVFLTKSVNNLRVVYGIQAINSLSHVTVGSIFYAYRQEKFITLPALSADLLAALPATIERPQKTETVEELEPPVAEILNRGESDIIIDRTSGENRHLFSMPRSDWMKKGSPLTAQQRRVINDAKCPLRIHGPGGSGKTLVLILKALTLLTEAANRDEACKVLMILHNNDVRNNVRAAIEAIDESGFLATTKDDLQFLDVETLHSWCMRELRIDTGGFDYALHEDTVASKGIQDEILNDILEEQISTRFPRMKSFLSTDLVSHLLGPRDKLLSNCRHEIAIRIKGRGLRNEQQLYVENPLKSFVGVNENRHDRYFLFKIADEYEEALHKIARLDTDDIVLSMQSRLTAPLWSRQRITAGYDFVFVDETHLFNENERRVLQHLTRKVEEHVPIVMAFDEAQSIGGRRGIELEKVGIHKSQSRRLSYVHRSSPDIYNLARDLVERTTLMFSEFSGGESVPRMSDRDLKKCIKPSVYFSPGQTATVNQVVELALGFRSKNYPRVGIILFDGEFLQQVASAFHDKRAESHVLRERADSIAGNPFPGIFVMAAENCSGLEFDAVIMAGVDNGRVPPSLHDISPEGHMSVREEACRELYTAVTRARYHISFVCDYQYGPSELIEPWINRGMLEEKKMETIP